MPVCAIKACFLLWELVVSRGCTLNKHIQISPETMRRAMKVTGFTLSRKPEGWDRKGWKWKARHEAIQDIRKAVLRQPWDNELGTAPQPEQSDVRQNGRKWNQQGQVEPHKEAGPQGTKGLESMQWSRETKSRQRGGWFCRRWERGSRQVQETSEELKVADVEGLWL